jgi:protein required for attachment to host cells
MPKTWVLVSDTTRARIFEAEKPLSALTEVEDFVHTESRLREQELTSDQRPGRRQGSDGTGGHSMGHEDDPRKEEHQRFARQLAGYLEDALNARRFERLYVVTSPTFLGDLRAHFPKTVAQAVVGEVHKNITRLTLAEIREHLPERL